jgi:four helix bundle protein
MNPEDMKARTRAFALRIIRLAESLPNTPTANVIRKQMLRCGPSVGANYRAACRAKSKPDFVPRWEQWKKKPTKPFIGWSC